MRKPVPIRNPFRSPSRTVALEGQNAHLVRQALSGGSSPREAHPIQIPMARFDVSSFDGQDVFDGLFVSLFGKGNFDEGVFC